MRTAQLRLSAGRLIERNPTGAPGLAGDICGPSVRRARHQSASPAPDLLRREEAALRGWRRGQPTLGSAVASELNDRLIPMRPVSGEAGGRCSGLPAPQHLRHRATAGDLVDEPVQDPDPLHERVVDLLDADAADHAVHLVGERVHPRGGEEVLEGDLRGEVVLELRSVEAGEPGDHLIDLGLSAALALDLLHVEGVHRGERRREDPMHGRSVGRRCRWVH
jgi:hypothetical protein